jgi:hypothetical protein
MVNYDVYFVIKVRQVRTQNFSLGALLSLGLYIIYI